MPRKSPLLSFTLLSLIAILPALSQAQTAPSITVPRLVHFGGVALDLNGKPLTGTVGITFALYADQTGGAPLFLETQNVQPDADGHYSVLLGSTKTDGLPSDIFTSEQARWVGVQLEQQTEQARTLLVSAPYALKAGDAETIGGLPASAFVLAGSQPATGTTSASAKSSAAKNNSTPANPDVTGVGTIDYIPMWNTTSDIIDSLIFQKSSKIGINTTSPVTTLDVDGKTDVRDTLTLFPSGTDNSLAVSGTTFKVNSTGQVTFISGQTFPGAGTITGVNTATGSGLSGGGTSGTLSLKVPAAGITNTMLANSKITLNASTAGGLTVPAAMNLGGTYTIGLKTCSANQILQYSGSTWNCATATGTGTITGVTAGTDLTGGGTSGTVTLNVDTTKIPQLSAVNSFSGTSNTFTNSAFFDSDLREDGNGLNAGSYTPGLRFGSGSTGEAISSDRTGSVNSSGLDFYTAFTPRMSVTNNGQVGIGTQTPFGQFESVDAAQTGYAVYGTTTADYGTSILGYATSSTGSVWGMEGATESSASDAYGLVGFALNDSGNPIGVYGYSYAISGIGVRGGSTDIGISGQAGGASSEGVDQGYNVGVWGDTGGATASYYVGVLGSADDNWAGYFINNSDSRPTLYVSNAGTGGTGLVLDAHGNSGDCTIDGRGNMGCSGAVTSVVDADSGARKVSLYAMQSADNWFEDAGSGQLANGATSVALDATFAQTVNTGVEYHVFLTPKGDCEGLYVSHETAQGFEVHELRGGHSSIAFDYRIMAKRNGYETARLADVTEQYQQLAQQQQLRQAQSAKHIVAKPNGKRVKGPVPAALIARKGK